MKREIGYTYHYPLDRYRLSIVYYTPELGELAPNPGHSPLVDMNLAHPPEAWVLRAACGRPEVDRDEMFPDSANRVTYEHARDFCNTCPVKSECRTLGFDEPEGMWGGLTPQERVALGGGMGKYDGTDPSGRLMPRKL